MLTITADAVDVATLLLLLRSLATSTIPAPGPPSRLVALCSGQSRGLDVCVVCV